MTPDHPTIRITLVAALAGFIGACGGSGSGQGKGGSSGSGVTSGGGSSAVGGNTDSGGRSAQGGSQGGGGAGGSAGASTPSVVGGASNPDSHTGGRGGGTGTGGSGEGGRVDSGGTTAAAGSSGAAGTTAGGTGGGSGSRVDGGLSGDASPVDGAKPDAPGFDGGASQTCPAGMAAPSAGNRKGNLQHGGKSRSYALHVPSGLSAGKPLAVVFDLHGAGGSGSSQQSQSGWGAVADRDKFLMVYPDGVDGYWNVDDTCCGTAGKQKIDDVGFLKAIVTQLNKDLCIDAKRLYVTGFSNGGGLAHRMGCDAADVFAAIAPMATDLRTQPCKPARPISMMEFRGTADSLEPYEGGVVGPAGGQYVDVGAKASLKLWADIDQCTGTPATIDKYCESYTTCQDGVEADLCSLPGVDHSPYGNSLNFNVAEIAWKMFQRQPMK